MRVTAIYQRAVRVKLNTLAVTFGNIYENLGECFMNNACVTDDMVFIIPAPSERPIKVVFESSRGLSDALDALLSSMRRMGISSHEAADAFSSFAYAMEALPEDDEPQESQELDGFLDEFTILKEQEVY